MRFLAFAVLLIYSCASEPQLKEKPLQEIWPISEVLVDSTDQLQGNLSAILSLPADRFEHRVDTANSISRDFDTYLRFSLPAREDSLFLYLDPKILEFELLLESGFTAITGLDIAHNQLAWKQTRSTLPIPPGDAEWVILRLSDGYQNHFSSDTRSFPIQLWNTEFSSYYDSFLGINRPRPYKSGNIAFITILGFILLLVGLAFLIYRRPIYLAYLGYNGWVWLYYFIKKGELLAIPSLNLSSGTKHSFEAIGSIVIILGYLYFARSFLRLSKSAADEKIDSHFQKLIKAAWFLLLLTMGSLFGISKGLGFMVSVIGQTLILAFGAYTLWLAWQRKDQLSSILVRAASVLVISIGILYFRWFVTFLWPECPDIQPFGMSLFQFGVLVESLILLAGLLVHDRQSKAEAIQANRAKIQVLEQQLAANSVANPSQQILPIGKNRQLDLSLLLYLKTEGRDRFSAFYADGSSETYPMRLSHAEKTYFSTEPQLVRHHKSGIVWLPAIAHYRAKGKHEIRLKDSTEILRVSAQYRDSFALKYQPVATADKSGSLKEPSIGG